jgi:PTS system ascorbate-specific IIC component
MQGNVFVDVITWLANNIIKDPAILLGIVALVGLLLQKKSFSDTVQGTLKTIVGFLILQNGSGILVNAILGLQPIMEAAFGVKAAGLGGARLDEFIGKWGGYAALIMTGGFLLNLLLARITPFKFVYLTGHLMWWIALLIPAIILEAAPNTSVGLIIGISIVICGVYWTLQPAYVQPLMKKIMGHGEIALGHTSSFNDWLGGTFGKYFGSPKDSTEKMKLPAWMGFFRDVTAGVGFLIALLLLVLAIVALVLGKAGTTDTGTSATYLLNAIKLGLNFSMGITVLLFGVRMVIAEIVPAFRGFALKVVPDAKPALDCPVVFDYAPTAVIVGFVSATIAFFLLMVLFGPVLKWTTIVPPFIMLFFPGGAGGVFGNATGGVKGAIWGGAICGILLAVGQAIVTPMLSTTAPELALIADPDWYILVLVFKPLFALLLPK